MQRLRQNLFLKLVSLACAFGLFLYVRKAESTERDEIAVPLTPLIDRDVKVVEPTVPRTILVTLRGPADVIRAIRPSQITATVDLRGKGALPPTTVPVQVDLPQDLRVRNVTADWNPRSIKVRLDEVITRYLQVTPRIDAQPPPGEAFGVPEVYPLTVTVTGLREVVNRVRQVRAVVNEINGKGAVDVLARVSAVDDAGTELRDRLQIQPAAVKLHIPLERRVWTKSDVYADPRLSPLPPGLLVRSLTVRPPKVEVTGADRTLADLWVLPTETVLLPPMEGHYERIVRIIPPEGVKRVDPPQVHVMVELYRGQPAVSARRPSAASRGAAPAPPKGSGP